MNKNKGYEEEYFEAEGHINELKVNKMQLHHQLQAIETQLDEVEGIYQIVKEASQKPNTSDHMDTNLSQLRSLIEIAQRHNEMYMEEQ